MEIQGYEVKEDLYYMKDHYWLKPENDLWVIGMDDFGQKLAGDIVYVEMPFEGKRLKKGKRFASIESGKWVGKVIAPFNGELVESNEALEKSPNLINLDCYGVGWMYKVRASEEFDGSELIHGIEDLKMWMQDDIRQYSQS